MGEPMTRERLENYIKLKTEVERYNERIARMKNEEQFPSRRESDGSQHQPGNGDRMESAIIRRLGYEEKMAAQIQANIDEMDAVEAAINSLDDPLERDVLRFRYLEGENYRLQNWRDVALRLYHDNDERHLQAAHRLHRKALDSIQMIANCEMFDSKCQ